MAHAEPWTDQRGREVIAAHQADEGPLLPILHALQETFGHVPEAAVPIVAEALNLSRAEVHGVVTFYHDYRAKPAGKHVVKLCRAEACQSMGCEDLVERAEARLNVKCGGTSADGRVTLEPIYCLGLCATAPSALVDGRVVGRLDAKKLDAILDEAMR